MLDIPKRFEMIFKDAVDNLRFLKQQQWTVTRDALAAYAAVFAISRLSNNDTLHKLLIIPLVMVAFYSLYILCENVDALAKFRRRLSWIYSKHFESDEREALELGCPKGWFNRWGFIAGLTIVSLVGAAIAGWALFSAPAP